MNRLSRAVWIGVAGCLMFHDTGRTAPTEASSKTSAKVIAPPARYIAAGSILDYQVLAAPVPMQQLGPVSLAAVDRLTGTPTAVPPVLGPVSADWPPAGWPARSLAEEPGTTAAPAPLGSCGNRDRERPCSPITADTEAERVAVLYATRRFTIGDEIASLRMLHLRMRYRDGLVVYINGREVARRNLRRDAGVNQVAIRPHGPEWETFFIPVVPGLLVPGSNLLAVEVRPSGRRLVPGLDLELTAATRARIVRGPMVQRVGATSAVLVFETDLPTRAAVEYGATAERGLLAVSAGGGLAMRHVVSLTDLPAGQAVHYRVMAGSDVSAALAFHTAPAAGEVLRFVVYGDVRGGHRVHGAIAEAIVKEAPDLVLSTGDLVLRGSDEGDWQTFFAVTAGLLARIPYYPVAGNHDLGFSGDQRRRMSEIFALWPAPDGRPRWGHWYSFGVAGVHFVMLDSNAYQHPAQLAWLERDLQAARQRGIRAIFAVVHDGPYSRGLHRGNRYAAEHYAPILARHKVTLLFSGHDHLYQRGEIHGLAYMVSGGGGAALYSIRCGIAGKRPCEVEDGMQHAASEHHYIAVTVFPGHVQACPMRVDGTPLEACVTYLLP